MSGQQQPPRCDTRRDLTLLCHELFGRNIRKEIANCTQFTPNGHTTNETRAARLRLSRQLRRHTPLSHANLLLICDVFKKVARGHNWVSPHPLVKECELLRRARLLDAFGRWVRQKKF
jgi:hypothetical protein